MREKECYGIFYSFKVSEDLLKHVPFHLKTDHKNLVYINCALTGKVARWKLFMQDWNYTISWVEGQEEHQQVPDKLSRRIGGLAHSQYTKGVGTYRDPETQVVRLDRLHCWLSPDSPPPELKGPLRVHHSGRAISMDTSGHGTERSWPLLST